MKKVSLSIFVLIILSSLFIFTSSIKADGSINRKGHRWYQDTDGSWILYETNNDGSATKQLCNWQLAPRSNSVADQFKSKVWFYLDPNNDCKMKTGLITVDNDTYYLDTSGAMLTDWHQINNNYYYFDGSNGGRAKTGWQQGASGWYYLDPTTKIMVTNKTLIINGTAYTFDSNGKWIS